MSNTIAATPIAMTALSRRPRATAAVKRMGRACACDSANSYGSGGSVEAGPDFSAVPGLIPLLLFPPATLIRRTLEDSDDHSPAQPSHHPWLRPRGLQRGGLRRARESQAPSDHRRRDRRTADDHHGRRQLAG